MYMTSFVERNHASPHLSLINRNVWKKEKTEINTDGSFRVFSSVQLRNPLFQFRLYRWEKQVRTLDRECNRDTTQKFRKAAHRYIAPQVRSTAHVSDAAAPSGLYGNTNTVWLSKSYFTKCLWRHRIRLTLYFTESFGVVSFIGLKECQNICKNIRMRLNVESDAI